MIYGEEWKGMLDKKLKTTARLLRPAPNQNDKVG